MVMSQIIYCDESGFSGNNLADDGNPYFVYSSVRFEPEAASNLVAQVKKDFKLQGEIKGANLTKHALGRRALTQLIKTCAPESKLIVAHKKFALAGKLFEYIFEPPLAENSLLFYNIGFQKYIANLLHGDLITKHETAGELLVKFQEAMRALDFAKLADLLAEDHKPPKGDYSPRELVVRFARAANGPALAELESLRDQGGVGKWVLDLSSTSLNGLLSAWGEQMDNMEVMCDDSKPLKDLQEVFNLRVGKFERKYIELEGRRQLLTYSLAGPIRFASSRDFPGLQLADALASALAFSLNHSDDKVALTWGQMLFESVNDAIMPDLDYVDLKHPSAVLNAAILAELIRRAESAEPLLDGIEQFVSWMNSRLPDLMHYLGPSRRNNSESKRKTKTKNK
jgi:hypothetical protein